MTLSSMLVTILSIAAPLSAAEANRPNILFAFADDWGRYASIYAKTDGPSSMNDVVRTPTFDRLAKEGVLFRRAFVSAPSCTPCRSALMSGQHFWRTGRSAILSGAIWDGSNPAFPLMLRDAGYHIGETYKVWSPGTPNDAPFGAGKYAYEKAGGRFNNFSENVTDAVSKGTPLDAAKQSLYDEIQGNFDAFIAARPAGQPFLYWFGPTNVHRMWTRGSGKALWGIDPDTLKGKLPKFLPDVPEVREDIADYFGEIRAWDTAVGSLLKRLEELGELDNTLIIMSGDHGPPGFPHGKCNLYDFGVGVSLAIRWGGAKGGRVVDDLVSMTDIAPTLLEIAGVARPEVMTGRSLVNVLKSDKAGQVDPQRTAIFTGRERHVDTARAGNLPYPQRAIRTPEYLYIINFHPERTPMGDPLQESTATHAELVNNTRIAFQDMDSGPTKAWLVEHRNDPQWKPYYDRAFAPRPREELYVIADDPDEVHNVAGDAKYANLRAEAEKRLMDELRRTGDPRVIDNGRFFETSPMTDAAATPAAKKAKKAR